MCVSLWTLWSNLTASTTSQCKLNLWRNQSKRLQICNRTKMGWEKTTKVKMINKTQLNKMSLMIWMIFSTSLMRWMKINPKPKIPKINCFNRQTCKRSREMRKGPPIKSIIGSLSVRNWGSKSTWRTTLPWAMLDRVYSQRLNASWYCIIAWFNLLWGWENTVLLARCKTNFNQFCLCKLSKLIKSKHFKP